MEQINIVKWNFMAGKKLLVMFSFSIDLSYLTLKFREYPSA
jgi:hypothetical protein